MAKLRLAAGLLDTKDIKLVPSISPPKLDTSFEKSQINLQLRDVTVLYTPELSRAKIESVFGTE